MILYPHESPCVLERTLNTHFFYYTVVTFEQNTGRISAHQPYAFGHDLGSNGTQTEILRDLSFKTRR